MERYKNLGGNSGVQNFEINNDNIKVQFKGTHKIYKYSYNGKAGKMHVDNMKLLARQGAGLNSYIKKNANKLFD